MRVRYNPRGPAQSVRTIVLFMACIVAALYYFSGSGGRSPRSGTRTMTGPPAAAPTTSPAEIARLESLMRAADGAPRKDGVAVAIMLDTSGSMEDKVSAAGGPQRKLDIARRAVYSIVRQAETHAREQPGVPLLVGIYEFSTRGRSSCRTVVPLGPPDAAAAERAMRALRPDGQTPIGDSMVQAKRDLDATGLNRAHMLVVTDGANTAGAAPGNAMWAIARLPEDQRPGVYFVAFDVDSEVFRDVREAGALILPAADEQQLQQRLNYVMGTRILVE